MSEPHRLNSPAKRGTQAPNGSVLTYGFVACCLALTGLLVLAGFYDIDLKPQGLAIIALGVLAFTSESFCTSGGLRETERPMFKLLLSPLHHTTRNSDDHADKDHTISPPNPWFRRNCQHSGRVPSICSGSSTLRVSDCDIAIQGKAE
jgi:hypothetical protein